MARFAILITHPPLDSGKGYAAYRFASAVLDTGHELTGVFFYQAGVEVSNSFVLPFNDEVNLHQCWCELANKFNMPLWVCVTAANRRGIIGHSDAQTDKGFNLQAPFEEVGLGEFIKLSQQCDRLVQF